jgi:hypothetical protein
MQPLRVVGATNLVQNGDFELPDCAGTTCLNTPPTAWTNSFGDNDLAATDVWDAESGKQSVDLNGDQPGGLFQDLTTSPGQSYVIAFFYAGNFYGNNSVLKTFNVTWGGGDVHGFSFDATGRTAHAMGWTVATYIVTANSTTTRLEFDSTTINDAQHGPALDAVSVILAPASAIAETPLAASLIGLGVFLTGTVAIGRHRRSKRRTSKGY